MAYSWLRLASGGIQVVDTHLSYSLDNGNTWTYKGPLYTAQPTTDPITGAAEYTSHEVMNLLPQVVGGVTYWFGIHQTYNLAATGHNQVAGSIRWWLSVAPDNSGTNNYGPYGLATSANIEYLGTPSTNTAGWPVAQNLSALSSDLTGCQAYFEPALILQGTTLYLFLNCQTSNGALPFYAVFSTPNPESISSWTSTPPVWTYGGGGGASAFATSSDARNACYYTWTPDLCTANIMFLTQMDVAQSRNSGTIAIASVVYLTSGKISTGCVAIQMASISPPSFVQPLNIEAVLTSTDSISEGPGSCTYSPASATGVILAHRVSSAAAQDGGFFTYLLQSALAP
jgi:hypothetical protein